MANREWSDGRFRESGFRICSRFRIERLLHRDLWIGCHCLPAQLTRGQCRVRPPGSPVEITKGDSVGFDPSKGVLITNVASTTDLVLKRALFTVEVPSLKAPVVSGALVIVDAKGALPQPLVDGRGTVPNTVQLISVQAIENVPCDAGIRLGKPAGALRGDDRAGYLLELGFAG